ncbi:MAG: hypothetical protein KC619_28275 [Myxococcales bacterium]|nr:hypothetical protein [Myxococcales bacterium]
MSLETIQSTHGRSLDLESLRGRTVVVFYESRDHVDDNLLLKESCGLLSEGAAMRNRLEVLGVADVEGLGFVRPVVTAAVRQVARRYGAEIWMDFDGVLKRAPFAFGRRGSTVAILDPSGALVFREDGPLDADALDAFFTALGGSLDRRAVRELVGRVGQAGV